jgi:uncharacterized protein (TIGR03437 family)
MNGRLRKLFVGTVLAAVSAAAQNTPVPSQYQDLYTALQQNLDAFAATVTAGSTGPKSPVAFGVELDTVNANRGTQLLASNTFSGVVLELNSLQKLGVQSVTIAIGFPMLYQDFYTFNGDPADYASFLSFYKQVVAEVRKRGLTLVIETGLLFPGTYSAGSNFNLAGYYQTLTSDQINDARAQEAVLLAQQLQPDWLALGSEPDTEAAILNQSAYQPDTYATAVASRLTQVRAAGVSGTLLGAGIGTWQSNGTSFLQSLLATDLDFINLHVYPVNFAFLTPDTLTYVDMVKAAGKRVGMGEVWLLKEADSEVSTTNVADNSTVFARDPYSFWAPLDQEFLTSLVNLAYWKGIDFISPFWTRYFYAYLDYDNTSAMTPDEIIAAASSAEASALASGTFTSTATSYSSLIAPVGTQFGAVSAASYTGPLAPNAIISIFGTSLAATSVHASSLPLPISLGGVSVTVADRTGTQQQSPLFFVSPQQINAQIPNGLAAGPATLSITTSSGAVVRRFVTLAGVAPGLFAANSTGAGPAAAYLVITHADLSQTSELVAQCGAAGCTPVPLSLGSPTDTPALVLYGTGIRGAALSSVSVSIGAQNLSPFYAGAAPGFAGLDQVNVTLPKSLAGAGLVNLTLSIAGAASNTLTADFQ